MAQEHVLKILLIEQVNHNVKRFIVEKPSGFKFIPGHSAMISINKPEWKNKKRSFTFTSTNDDLVLEFTIKKYDSPESVTSKLHSLNPGDEIIISDIFGSIRYLNPGIWIAAGTGITPFLAIARQLKKDNALQENFLIYSNKTQSDIINENELRYLFGSKIIFTLTSEKKEGYEHGKINFDFLKKHIFDFKKDFYVCGPDGFVIDVKKSISELKSEARIYDF